MWSTATLLGKQGSKEESTTPDDPPGVVQTSPGSEWELVCKKGPHMAGCRSPPVAGVLWGLVMAEETPSQTGACLPEADKAVKA